MQICRSKYANTYTDIQTHTHTEWKLVFLNGVWGHIMRQSFTQCHGVTICYHCPIWPVSSVI